MPSLLCVAHRAQHTEGSVKEGTQACMNMAGTVSHFSAAVGGMRQAKVEWLVRVHIVYVCAYSKKKAQRWQRCM